MGSAAGPPPSELSPVELAHFAEQGYLRVEGLLDDGAVATTVQELQDWLPPDEDGAVGPTFAFPSSTELPVLAELQERIAPLAGQLMGVPPDRLPRQPSAQLARTLPPFPRGVGRPHIDGTVGEPGGRPGTFSLLAGVVLTDQSCPDAGALWVWPGSHREHAAHFAAHGPEAFWAGDPGFPDVTRAQPVQLLARAGDLIFAHYLLGHCPGGVTTRPRTTVYYRLSRHDHDEHWRAAMTDADRDFPGCKVG